MSPGSTSRADANRRRILDVALAELLRDPDASMDRIARAAGVVRRTVYGHFPSREALIGTLADEAVAALATADTAGREGVANPAEALARWVLAVWDVADRYPTATGCWSRRTSARSPCRASRSGSPRSARTRSGCSGAGSTRAPSSHPCRRRPWRPSTSGSSSR